MAPRTGTSLVPRKEHLLPSFKLAAFPTGGDRLQYLQSLIDDWLLLMIDATCTCSSWMAGMRKRYHQLCSQFIYHVKQLDISSLRLHFSPSLRLGLSLSLSPCVCFSVSRCLFLSLSRRLSVILRLSIQYYVCLPVESTVQSWPC